MSAPSHEPVRRTHVVPASSPREVYDVVVDFEAYPRFFKEFTTVKVLSRSPATAGETVRVEFRAQVVIAVRYVLDLVCNPDALSVNWTFVEGEAVTNSTGGWRFFPEGSGTRIDYHAALEVRAPLPGFMLRKISDTLVSASIPAMFSALEREVAARRR